MSEIQTFEIDGHEYSFTLHAPSEGMPISLLLSSTAIAGAARGLASGLGGEGGEKAIGEVASAVAGLLERKDAPQIMRRVLIHCFRDGKPLRDDVEFDRAYAGRYDELFEAVVAVSVSNGFFPGLATFSRVAKRLGISLQPIGQAEPRD